jgi:hypothetical protein
MAWWFCPMARRRLREVQLDDETSASHHGPWQGSEESYFQTLMEWLYYAIFATRRFDSLAESLSGQSCDGGSS